MSVESLFSTLARSGVLHRSEVRSDPTGLEGLLRTKLVAKVPRRKKVFYELTEKALPLLELHRRALLTEVEKRAALSPRSRVYRALLSDLRFLDSRNERAREFLFLGDWQLTHPVVPSQIELAKLRYYIAQGLS